MCDAKSAITKHVECETFAAMLGMYSVAIWCLPKALQSEPQWEKARKAFENAESFARTPHTFNASAAGNWFLRGCEYLAELDVDLQELPMLAVNPARYAEVREAFDLPSLDHLSE